MTLPSKSIWKREIYHILSLQKCIPILLGKKNVIVWHKFTMTDTSHLYITKELCSREIIKKCRHTYLQHRMKYSYAAFESELHVLQVNLFSKKIYDWETVGGFLQWKYIKFLGQEEGWQFPWTYQRENLAVLERMLPSVKWSRFLKGIAYNAKYRTKYSVIRESRPDG